MAEESLRVLHVISLAPDQDPIVKIIKKPFVDTVLMRFNYGRRMVNDILTGCYEEARKLFLAGGYDILWFNEYDTVPQDYELLLDSVMEDFKNGADIVAFPYRLRYDGDVCIFYWDNFFKRIHSVTYNEELALKLYDKKEIFKIDQFAFGCTFLSRKVMEKVDFRDYDMRFPELLTLSYDLFFAERCKREGFKIFCDPRVYCDHHDPKAGRIYKVEELFDQPQKFLPKELFDFRKLLDLKKDPKGMRLKFFSQKLLTPERQAIPCLVCSKWELRFTGQRVDDIAYFECGHCKTILKAHLETGEIKIGENEKE